MTKNQMPPSPPEILAPAGNRRSFLAAMKVEGVNRVKVDFVWSPPWTPEKMTEDGKKQMRMFGFNL